MNMSQFIWRKSQCRRKSIRSVIRVVQLCPTFCNPMTCSTPGFPVPRHFPEFAQNHIHWVGDAIQPSHSLSSPSPPAFNLAQHQDLFQWVSSSHQVARVLELQHQSFQRIFRTEHREVQLQIDRAVGGELSKTMEILVMTNSKGGESFPGKDSI